MRQECPRCGYRGCVSTSSKDLTVGVVVLAGGSGRRLGGVDKAAVEVDGQSMLEHVIASFPQEHAMVIVGPARRTSRSVAWCREFPIGGGPLSAVATAIGYLSTDLVAIAACDSPLVGPVIADLIAMARRSVGAGGDGAGVRTTEGGSPPIPSCVRRPALVAALPETVDNGPLWPVVNSLSLERLTVVDTHLQDVDTPGDLALVTVLMTQQRGATHE